jgi:CheY-like chemotaxis protein
MAGNRLLIVEDDIIIGTEMQGALESFGYVVLDIVDRGENVVAVVKEQNPDLVLMDIRLKGFMSGLDAASQIRGFSSVPIVFVTGYKDDTTVRLIATIPGTALLTKPVDYGKLKQVLTQFLK